MRYSVRQQHCLQSMGIVPWVSRFPENAAPAATAVSSAETADAVDADTVPIASGSVETPLPVPEMVTPVATSTTETRPVQPSPAAEPAPAIVTTEAEVSSPEASPVQPPQATDALAQWLLEQALVPIEFRNGLHPVLGVADAPLLVVLAHDEPSPTAGSMAGDDGRLFELMLRSISLSNRDTRRCQLGHRTRHANTVGGDAVSQSGVSALCTANTRGVLVLMSPWPFDVSDIAVPQHQGRLPGSGLPVWRIAHPTILLEQPQLKRQAWHVLKNLRAVLDGAAL